MNRREFTQIFASAAVALAPLSRFVAQAQTAVGLTPSATPAGVPTALTPSTQAKGVVYGVRENRKFPLPKVRVSNGREVVVTDRLGRYTLPVQDGDIVFVTKPRGYALPLNALNLPQFYRIHQPAGSPATIQEFPGIAPTGALPASIDFTLTEHKENDEFRVLLFGDPQSRNQEEIGFLTEDVIADVAGEEAAFGVVLGDIAFNDLSIYPNHNRTMAAMGLTWFNVMGNHDINFEAADRTHSAETYKSNYGPTYFSFDYGSTHFVVLDNVCYEGKPADAKRGVYHGELGAKQLTWLENDLKLVPREQLVVLMMHIPIANRDTVKTGAAKPTEGPMKDRAQFLRILQNHPHTLSISAHTHRHENLYLGREAGWNGVGEHHHLNQGTTCGSWWAGVKDEEGIPHATMSDGVPNGYSFLNIKGNTYTVDYKASRREASHQMKIYAPLEVKQADLAKTEIMANVFAGSAKSKVEMQIGGGAWRAMQPALRPDPGFVAAKTAQEGLPAIAGRPLPAFGNCSHLWAATLPAMLPAGAHLVQVRTTDVWNRTFEERRVVRVVA